jgi:hypothetical protein
MTLPDRDYPFTTIATEPRPTAPGLGWKKISITVGLIGLAYSFAVLWLLQ